MAQAVSSLTYVNTNLAALQDKKKLQTFHNDLLKISCVKVKKSQNITPWPFSFVICNVFRGSGILPCTSEGRKK